RTPEEGADELEEALASRGVGTSERLVAAAPGSRWATKRWDPARFGAAVSRLSDELGWRAVVTGSPAETESGRRAAESAGRGAVDLTGELSLNGLIALAARAELLLSNDSAAAHVAAGVGTPVVAVFGPTVPAQGFAPYSERSRIVESRLECRPCGRHGADRCPRGALECMDNVGVDDVVSAALDLVGSEVR
ncbi:MAG: hypothetical protein GF400_08010, partial [Candidatus Eisenbacteria bacterium]|nr:hypothetical protein [Candidatus Eisenbacteria bacterium]